MTQHVPTAIATVQERGLVTETVKYADVIKNHKIYSPAQANEKQLPSSMISLGYVTPVN